MSILIEFDLVDVNIKFRNNSILYVSVKNKI